MLSVIKALTRTQKLWILTGIDVAIVPLALYITFAVQFNMLWPAAPFVSIQPILPYWLIAAGILTNVLGITRIQLNAFEIRAAGRAGLLAIYLALVAAGLSRVAGLAFPLGTFMIFAAIYFLMVNTSRVLMLELLTAMYRRDHPRCRVLIYGAGTTGAQLAQALSNHETIEPVAFVDDNSAMQGLTVVGLPVYTPVRVAEIVDTKHIDRVLLAIPSLSYPKQMQLAHKLTKIGLEVQSIPSFAQLIGEEALVDKLTTLSPDTFLGRDELDGELAEDITTYAGKTVLISGAGGTIGAELCRQVMEHKPTRLIMYELSELALYTVNAELSPLAAEHGIELVPVLGSVTDQRQVRHVLSQHKVQVILHAAAYKHVPLVELNPLAGLANNVFGAHTLAREAEAHGVERFILISSDKAVRPTSVMGASKRFAELVLQDLASRSRGTVFAMVRFGNVLGSSGSVVPIFQEQIARGGPVTVTDKRVTRYFMTVQEAVRLVLVAGSFAEGGEVFVLDMGKPVPIMRLAQQAIEAAGYSVRDEKTPDGDIEIIIIGLRPGEKMHEELMISKGRVSTAHPKIFSVTEARLSEIEVASALRALRQAVASGDAEAARAVALRWVDGYTPKPAVIQS